MIRAEAVEPKHEHTPPVGVKWHEYADIFPWIEGEAFRSFVEDVRKNGVLEPIVFLDGAILDGRNRYMAARELGIEYPRVEYEGDDPLGFVISHNLTRRHLTESQRGMVAAKLAKMKPGDNQHTVGPANLRNHQAAEMLNVSTRTVEAAQRIVKQGSPELISAVESGAVSVSAAADIATLPKPEQTEIVARGEKEILQAAKAIRADKVEAKKNARIANSQQIAANNAALPVSLRTEMAHDLAKLVYAKSDWLHRFSSGKLKRADNEIETKRRELIVLQQAKEDYQRASEKQHAHSH